MSGRFIGLSENLLNCYNACMLNLNCESKAFTIIATALCGLSQGDELSPILWPLVADSLLKWLSNQGAFAQVYADDDAVLICGRILSTICDIS